MENTTDWFVDWFNTPYYHLLYANRNEAEAQQFIQTLLTHLKLEKGSRILDAACGKGRHSKVIHSLGYEVLGFDLSTESIAYAQSLAAQASSSHLPSLSFEVKDIRKLDYENEFDLVVNLFTSFGYFEDPADDLLAIQGFQRALKTNGVLVIDFLNASFVANRLVSNEEVVRGDLRFQIERVIENGWVKKHIRFEANGNAHHFTEQVKLLTRSDFEGMLKKAGCKVKQVWGDYSLGAFEEQTSPRLLIFAQKAS